MSLSIDVVVRVLNKFIWTAYGFRKLQFAYTNTSPRLSCRRRTLSVFQLNFLWIKLFMFLTLWWEKYYVCNSTATTSESIYQYIMFKYAFLFPLWMFTYIICKVHYCILICFWLLCITGKKKFYFFHILNKEIILLWLTSSWSSFSLINNF